MMVLCETSGLGNGSMTGVSPPLPPSPPPVFSGKRKEDCPELLQSHKRTVLSLCFAMRDRKKEREKKRLKTRRREKEGGKEKTLRAKKPREGGFNFPLH
jgi:hypothetical protein